ncbi:MAG: imidazole glycerol phosphate synthase subunit HisF [Patescibacteria group bacterium]
MLAKRIIPCLDVKNGILTKGIKFQNNVQVQDGDPVKIAKFYSDQGADELIFYDISASAENKNTITELVEQISEVINIPFCVGGGIRNVRDMRKILLAGADKISINSAAVLNPQLISDGAKQFGSQCIVVGIDVSKDKIFINGAKQNTDINVLGWVKRIKKLGAGEICINSIDQDGLQNGYDLELLKKIRRAVNIPIIASGGAGTLKHLADAAKIADGLLAASIFHYNKLTIKQVKQYLNNQNICVRL